LSCTALVVSANAGTTFELIQNGGFETGNFTGWSPNVQAGSSGNLYAASGTTTPLSSHTTVGPDSGTFYAVTDQTGGGAYSLTQSFTVTPGATSVILSFDLFANDYAGVVTTGALNSTSGPREFATADLLTGTANPFSTAAGDVLQNFYTGADNLAANPNPYTAYSFDITGLVSAGGTFQIRFGEADNQGYFTMGVDNVSVLETTPEPTTFILIAPFLAGLAMWKRKSLKA
jgi:hypothetical protein